MPNRKGLPFMRMDGGMTGRYFVVQSSKPYRVVSALRKRFKDMRFTPQEHSFKVLATYIDKSKEVQDDRSREIEDFIRKVQEE